MPGVGLDGLCQTCRRTERRKTHDQAELRCRGRHQIGGHAGGGRGRPGAGRRCLRRRAGGRRPDLRAAVTAVFGDVDRRCEAACRSRAAASRRGAGEERLAAALSDAVAAVRHLVQDAAEDARPISSGLSIRTYDKISSEVFRSRRRQGGARSALRIRCRNWPTAVSTRCCRPVTAAPAASCGSTCPISARSPIRCRSRSRP